MDVIADEKAGKLGAHDTGRSWSARSPTRSVLQLLRPVHAHGEGLGAALAIDGHVEMLAVGHGEIELVEDGVRVEVEQRLRRGGGERVAASRDVGGKQGGIRRVAEEQLFAVLAPRALERAAAGDLPLALGSGVVRVGTEGDDVDLVATGVA